MKPVAYECNFSQPDKSFGKVEMEIKKLLDMESLPTEAEWEYAA